MSHLDLSVLCNKSYDRKRADIWSVLENDALVKERADRVQIAHRGTEFTNSIFNGRFSLEALSNGVDVLKDLRFWPTRTPTGWSHKGFARGAEIWCAVYAMRLAQFKKPLEITGHSLGAAVAMQSVCLLKDMGFDILEVVVFGEPASFYFGSERNYRALGISTTSYLNGADWIRLAPPWGSPGVERTLLNPINGLQLKDHHITQYTRALEK